MAKKENQETRTKIDDLNDSLTRAEQHVQNNKKLIMWICIGVAAVVVAILIFLYGFFFPSKNKANAQYGQASLSAIVYEQTERNLPDSVAASQLAAITAEFEKVAESNGHDGGNNARLMAAIYQYKSGDYQKALDNLKDYDREDEIIAATSKALEGDCYVNLDKYQEAIECYQEAAKISNENPQIVPYCMLKEARVQRQLKNYAAEADLYKQLLENYPEYQSMSGVDFKLYYERAKAASEAK